jgi:hypothetical protein
MTRRVSTAAAIGIAFPSLLAGALLGIFLRSRATDAAVPPPRPAPPVARGIAPEPLPVAAPKAAEPAAPKAPAPAEKPKHFAAPWKALQNWLRGFDLATVAGRQKVRPDELQKRAAALQQALMSDPEGYLAVLRSPENDDLFKFLLSLLCRVVGLEGGHAALPRSEIPKPILDALPELLRSGTAKQKLGVLQLVQRDHWSLQGRLLDEKDLVERCDALYSDPDPMVRASAVQVVQSYAPAREDRRVEVLQELWGSSTDPMLRANCLQAVSMMGAPAARQFFVQALTQLAADGTWTKDATLMWTAIQAIQSQSSSFKPEEQERIVAVCSSALRSITDPQQYQGWMALSLYWPLDRATPLLEQAASLAPTPELKASAQRALAQIRAGETRADRLQAALRQQK